MPEGLPRKIKLLEKLSLNYEGVIFSEVNKNQRTREIVSNPESKILIVGDPNLVMAGFFSQNKVTVVEGDPKVAERMERFASEKGVKLVSGSYPTNLEGRYDLIVLKNIFSFNKNNPNFLSGVTKDLDGNGTVVISEPIFRRDFVPSALSDNGFNFEEKRFGFGATGSIFIAWKNKK